jgi:hypothetical protein
MEILIKESEYRFMPFGHVFSTTINSISELMRMYYSFKEDEGKRCSEVFFKLKDSNKEWLELKEFIFENFEGELLELSPKTVFLGVEEDGVIRDLKSITESDFIEDNKISHGFGMG